MSLPKLLRINNVMFSSPMVVKNNRKKASLDKTLATEKLTRTIFFSELLSPKLTLTLTLFNFVRIHFDLV